MPWCPKLVCVATGVPDMVLGETAGLTFYLYIVNSVATRDGEVKVGTALGKAVSLLEAQVLTCHGISATAL